MTDLVKCPFCDADLKHHLITGKYGHDYETLEVVFVACLNCISEAIVVERRKGTWKDTEVSWFEKQGKWREKENEQHQAITDDQ